MTKIKITRLGNDFTCYYWNANTKTFENLVNYNLVGDFDIQYDFIVLRKKWYERWWFNVKELWGRNEKSSS